MLFRAIGGEFPDADGSIDLVQDHPGGLSAVVAFTGRHLVYAPVSLGWLSTHVADGDYLAPVQPSFLQNLASATQTYPNSLDVVLAAPPLRKGSSISLRVASSEARDHPRVKRAMLYRREVRVYRHASCTEALLIIGRGICRRLEMSFEVPAGARGRGLGRELALAARSVVEEPVFAQTAPGNAASLRALLAAGYVPIGGEMLFVPVHREGGKQ